MAIAKLVVWVLVDNNTKLALGYPTRTLPEDYVNISGLRFMSPEQLADLTSNGLPGLGWYDYREATALGVSFQPDHVSQFASSVRSEIDTFRVKKIKEGFRHDFGGSIGVKTLQTEQEDMINWLGVMSGAQALMLIGQTDQDMFIRTKENDVVTLKPAQVIQLLLQMQSYISGIYSYTWGKKEEIKNATTIAQIEAAMKSLA